jgi:hypothetical protein
MINVMPQQKVQVNDADIVYQTMETSIVGSINNQKSRNKSTMKTIVLSAQLYGQEQFRVDCSHVAILPSLDASWSEWFEASNTFVINANENNDIIHYRGDGNVVTYRYVGGLETLYTDSGKRYQIINVLDEDGYSMQFQLFDDLTIGVKLIKDGMAIQFSSY